MKKMRSVLFVGLIAMSLLSCKTKNAEGDIQSVDQVRIAFLNAFNTCDVQAIGSLVDADAIWSVPGQPLVMGKDSVLASYTALFSAVHGKLDVKAGDIQIGGDWAILTTTYTRIDTILGAEPMIKQISGDNTFAFKKQADGSWKLARDIWNEVAPKPNCPMMDAKMECPKAKK